MRGLSLTMQSVEDLFVSFGGPTAVASLVGAKVTAASNWRVRSRIPVQYWEKLVAAGKKRGIKVTYDQLVHMHSDLDQRNSRKRA